MLWKHAEFSKVLLHDVIFLQRNEVSCCKLQEKLPFVTLLVCNGTVFSLESTGIQFSPRMRDV